MAAFKSWIEHLRSISSDQHLMQFFGFTKEVVEGLVGELITGANRLHLQDKLSKVVFRNENAGSKRDQLAERQVFSINTEIADFIAWLDFVNQPLTQRPASRVMNERAIFENREVEKVNGLPKLDDQTNNYTKNYLFDWFVAFGHFAEGNAGHSAGREIDQVSNTKLGSVLDLYRSAQC